MCGDLLRRRGIAFACAAQQTSANTPIGSVAVKLRRINTITGGSNANPLYGTHAPGDSRLFMIQQGTDVPSPDLAGKILYTNPTVVDSAVGTLLDFSVQLPGVLDITHFEKGLLGVAFHPEFNDSLSPGYRKFYTYSSEMRTAHPTVDYIHPELIPDPAAAGEQHCHAARVDRERNDERSRRFVAA